MHPVIEKSKTLDSNGSIGLSKRFGPRPFKLNVHQYYQMYDLGFFQGRRVELIEGEIVEMAPMKSPHAVAVQLLNEVLRKIFSRGHFVTVQMPIRLDEGNEPEPDLAVIKGKIRDFSDAHPTRAELIVEVSDSTLRFDRGKKAKVYAQFQIEDYWILNLKDRTLEVYRKPTLADDGTYVYSEKFEVSARSSIAPLKKSKSKVRLSDVLP